MSKFGSSVLAVGLAGIAGAGAWGSGCSAKKPTELVPGVFTQVQVPRNIAQISVVVKANGAIKFCQAYDASNGVVLLPETLGVVSGSSASTTVSIEVRAYDLAGANSNDATGCTGVPINAPVSAGGPGPRIIRRSVQTFVDQHVLFLPMPLSYSCFDLDCSTQSAQTCKGATCVDHTTDATKLVDFDPALVDGTQDCFPANQCFDGAVPAVPVDPETCTYGVPAGQMSGDGLNVRVFYQDMKQVKNAATGTYEQVVLPTSETEILDREDTEGFSILANKQFQLSKGLCALVKSAGISPPLDPPHGGPERYHTIVNVLASTKCASKTQLLPLCKNDRPTAAVTADGGTTTSVTCNVPLALVPAPSAIYMVMDNSHAMNGAFGQTGYATAINLSLGAPVFKHTYVGFQFLKHTEMDCTLPNPSAATPDIDFGIVPVTQPKIATSLLGWTDPGPKDLYLEAAMRPEAAYKRVADFATGLGEPLNVGAVMFFVNREPQSTLQGGGGGDAGAEGGVADAGGADAGLDPTFALDCPLSSGTDARTATRDALVAAVKAASAGTPSLQTYFVVLDNFQHLPPLGFFKEIETASGGSATTLNATSSQAQQVLANFAQTATQLGTCLYELPPGVDSSATLKYSNPLAPPGFPGVSDSGAIPYSAACNAASAKTANGWSIETSAGSNPTSHIRICGSACTSLQNMVVAVTGAALQASVGTDAGALVPEVPVTATMPCVTTSGAH